MAKKEKFEGDSVGTQFRQVAGLPERENDKPRDVTKDNELRRYAEPEGGYGGEGEEETDPRAGAVDPETVEALQFGEELSAKSGQGSTTPVDASTGPTVEGERLLEDGEPVKDEDED